MCDEIMVQVTAAYRNFQENMATVATINTNQKRMYWVGRHLMHTSAAECTLLLTWHWQWRLTLQKSFQSSQSVMCNQIPFNT